MFARTPRLMLRPGWREDAPALHAAIADEAVVRMLARVPWPYALADAEAFLSSPADAGGLPNLLVFARTAGDPALVGGIGLMRDAEGEIELGYWFARHAWGRGYATEAARAVLDMAAMLGVGRIVAGHLVENAASGRVLAKLGFTRTGRTAPRYSRALDRVVPTVRYVREEAMGEPLAA